MKSFGRILIVLFCLSGAAFAHELEITSLACLKTEDHLGGDECELRIFTDGVLREKLREDLSAGKTWPVNRTYSFTALIAVELWDLDSPDADDHLGTLAIASPRSPVARAAARLSRDGARYEVTYAVRVTQAVSPKAGARNALRAFSQDEKPGIFPTIDKKTLISDMGKRIEEPGLVAQADQALCGPNAVLHLLLKHDPKRYVELARDLYHTGRHRMATGGTIAPGRHLFAAAVPPGISPADWLTAASLRDAANVIFDFDPDDRFAGITLPAEMGMWMEGLLGCRRIEVNTTFVYGEIDALRAARDALESGNVVVLAVAAQIIPGQKAAPVNFANHWAVLLSVSAAGKRNQLKIWSWAKVYDLDLNEEEFEDFMWGSVTGFF